MMILKPPGRGFGGFFGRFDMKILFLSKPEKVQKYTKDKSLLKKYEIAYAEIDASDDEIIKAGQGAEVIVADAIAKVSDKVIEGIPTLKMIHSEGVAFNSFDVETATKNHVYVSNCKGMNATAVAEQAILLMLGVLKDVVNSIAFQKGMSSGSSTAPEFGHILDKKRIAFADKRPSSVKIIRINSIIYSTFLSE